MDILKQIKNFPPIEEQLEIIKSSNPLLKISLEDIGEVEVLVTAVLSDSVKPRTGDKHWEINYNDNWISVEQYIAKIFEFVGFKQITDCSGNIFLRMKRYILKEDKGDPDAVYRKLNKMGRKDLTFNIWHADNGYLEKRFTKAIDDIFNDGLNEISDVYSPKQIEEMREFVSVFPEDKFKMFIHSHYIKLYKIIVPDEQLEQCSVTPWVHGKWLPLGGTGMDLLLYNSQRNRLLFCEVKSQNDRLMPHQIDFINWNRESNCLPFILAVILRGNYPQWDIKNMVKATL